MTNGALKLKEMKLCMNLLQQYFSRSTFVIYFFLYNDDKNICDNITWERENIKVIGLVGPMDNTGFFPPLRYTLVLWVWWFPYHILVTPFVDLWSFIFYLILVPLLCVVPWPPLVWLLNLLTFIVLFLCDHMTFGTLL